MTSENDKKISQLTVRLTNPKSKATIGTGVLCYQKCLGDKVYIITASHCLFHDRDSFQNLLHEIIIELYDCNNNTYKSITATVNEKLLFKDENLDLGLLCLEKSLVEQTIGEIPQIRLISERFNFDNFVIKGFPNATKGKELATIKPIWQQKMTDVNKFQLKLIDDYSEWAIEGFSGSGAFLDANNEVYLFGIFTRFRPEEKGRVIYCQFLKQVNELLHQNYLPIISFSFLGEHGLTKTFFQKQIEKSIENLGNRYNKILNFKLPIAQKFSDIARDYYFKSRLLNIIDKWLIEDNWKKLNNNKEINAIEKCLSDFQELVKTWFLSLEFVPDKKIIYEWVVEKINQLDVEIENKKSDLYSKRRKEEEKTKEIKKDHSYKPPFENEIERLRQINLKNHKFEDKLNSQININLSNHPIMFIQGEAGSGKSHLLGDVANDRISNDLPTILLLGQHFNNNSTIEKNILSILDLKCTYEEFLITCNEIGKQVNSRFLILIDAINEGDGSQIWKTQLAGFINQIKNYPFIGLVITVRDTYFEYIVPEHIRKNNDITFLTHNGFKGNEYEALKLFCDIYKLEQPKFPILAPEFTNPLFLKLICEGVSNSTERSFPSSFQGMDKIFDYYIGSLNKVFQLKPIYYLKKNLVGEVVKKIADYFFQNKTRHLALTKVEGFFDVNYTKYPTLLLDLIQEGVFTKNLKKNYKTDEIEEIIYFTYERFGDYYIASQLLKKYLTKDKIIIACQKGNELGNLHFEYQNEGIIEAIAVILPEIYKLEIFEVFEWLFSKDLNTKNKFYSSDPQKLNYMLINSLQWRTSENIDIEKLTNWFRSENFQISNDVYLFKIFELTAFENHPFNSDMLFRIFNRYKMAERDGYFQKYIIDFSGYDDDGIALPLRRLIDWAWIPNISSETNYETARLTGQTLAWVLSSTCKELRDQATKAMVNLLEQQPVALISILEKFKNIDDLYILERLFAVAYGCTLRTNENKSIQKIAQFTFDTIFKKGVPITHILLRDYARNIVEYALYKKVKIKKLDEKLIRPPYRSIFPKLPTEDEVARYKIDYNSEEYKKMKYGRLYNHVHFSVIDWDFGNKTVEYKINQFSPVSFTFEETFKNWKGKLNAQQKKIINLLIKSHIDNEEILNYHQKSNSVLIIEKILENFTALIDYYNKKTENQFNKEDQKFIFEFVIPHFVNKYWLKNSNSKILKLNSAPVKRWIVQRVFEMGYDVELHGDYDDYQSIRSRYNQKINIEKISEKYQWIAFHEILASLTDHYKVEIYWGNETKYEFFKGTWQMYLRDIDPAFIKKNDLIVDNDGEVLADELFTTSKIKGWLPIQDYIYWNDGTTNSDWVKNLADLPKAKEFIFKVDDEGNEWVNLEHRYTWNSPKELGKDKYHSYKSLHFSLNTYIIHKKDRNKIVKFLINKNLWKDDILKNDQRQEGLFNRENFWSPAYFDLVQNSQWETISSNNYKVIVSTTGARGYNSEDKSGANMNYNIPCKFLFDGLGLQYSKIDGELQDNANQIIVKADSINGVLVRKDKLLKYLKSKDLELIWFISGEKIIKENNSVRPDFYHSKVPCGIFYLEDDIFKGEFKMFNRS